MCRLVAYVGASSSRHHILEGLERLEYGGYDSAGFTCVQSTSNRLIATKTLGEVSKLRASCIANGFDGALGLGHTRWSTHGKVSVENTHPHFDCTQSIALAHNGIIENYRDLKAPLLTAGHVFVSQTDSEVVAHLVEQLSTEHPSPVGLLTALVAQLEGAYALGIIAQCYPGTLLLVRKRSPLCVGIGSGEMFAASDPLAFAGKVDQVVFLPDNSFAVVTHDKLELYSFNGAPLSYSAEPLTLTWAPDGKKGHEHFMLKEIYEQKDVIYATIAAYKALDEHIWAQLQMTPAQLADVKEITIIACGTSYHAARIAAYFFELIAQVPTRVHIASEFRYAPFFANPASIYLGVSQSGETADTLESLRFVQHNNLPTLALTNIASSTLVRETDGFLLTYAGPEIAVASTKAFTAQLAALYIFAHRTAYQKQLISQSQYNHAFEDLAITAEILEHAIQQYKRIIIEQVAERYAHYKQIIFLGRGISYPFALEAALKLKEISYIFTDCYPAGELKHGSLALVDPHTPVFLFSTLDPVIYNKLLSNAQEVKARSGHLVVFAFEEQHDLIALADYAFVIPRVPALLAPLALTGLMQFFVYTIAKKLNRPIDKPRNLAKSVTVE